MRPQSKEYPVKRFILISRSDRVVQLYWYTPRPQGFGLATRTHPGGINALPVPHEGLNIGSIPHDAIQHRANSSASQSFVWFTRL
jgi:hypothetical protein